MTSLHEPVEDIFRRIDDAFFALDRELRFTYLNDSAAELLDVDPESAIGEVVWEEFSGAVDSTFQRECERAMERQESVDFEEYYEPLETWFEVRAYPSESGLSVYFRDVTDRVEREREPRRQHERLGALNDVNSLVHGLAESMFGLSSRSDIKRIVCERLADADSYEFAWISAIEDGEFVSEAEAGVENYLEHLSPPLGGPAEGPGPTARAHRTGEMQVVQDVETDPVYEPWHDHADDHGYRASAAVPIKDGDELYGVLNVYSDRAGAFDEEERDALRRLGSIVGYAILFVERDHELQCERNRLEFMNRLLRHNLLNSLNVVEARLELLDGRVDYEVADHLDTAVGRTGEMIDFVETIRKVTRVVGRGEEQKLKAVPVADTLADRVDRARDSYPDAEFHRESAPDVAVVADDLLGEVLDNVLVNAVQHNPSPNPTVWVDATADDEVVEVSVADDGPGIPDERKESVFDRESKAFHDPGTGFGLYLVSEIVDSYGGSIVVEDNDPEGTVFRLRFQCARGEESGEA